MANLFGLPKSPALKILTILVFGFVVLLIMGIALEMVGYA